MSGACIGKKCSTQISDTDWGYENTYMTLAADLARKASRTVVFLFSPSISQHCFNYKGSPMQILLDTCLNKFSDAKQTALVF